MKYFKKLSRFDSIWLLFYIIAILASSNWDAINIWFVLILINNIGNGFLAVRLSHTIDKWVCYLVFAVTIIGSFVWIHFGYVGNLANSIIALVSYMGIFFFSDFTIRETNLRLDIWLFIFGSVLGTIVFFFFYINGIVSSSPKLLVFNAGVFILGMLGKILALKSKDSTNLVFALQYLTSALLVLFTLTNDNLSVLIRYIMLFIMSIKGWQRWKELAKGHLRY
ncbi:hypothetical protein [Streptococcus merionis]|uniref:hypothetical protein n=1 Tax=Streptococcus merionis TaxID=400065 RepID=UPI0035127A3E